MHSRRVNMSSGKPTSHYLRRGTLLLLRVEWLITLSSFFKKVHNSLWKKSEIQKTALQGLTLFVFYQQFAARLKSYRSKPDFCNRPISPTLSESFLTTGA